METRIVTTEELEVFRIKLIGDFKAILAEERKGTPGYDEKGYKTKDVRMLLGCSVNKLKSLCRARKIRLKKIGGTVYFNREDVRRLLHEGY